MSAPAKSRRTSLILPALALAIIALIVLALSPTMRDGSQLGGVPAGADAATKPVKIAIKDFTFSKKTVTVKVGRKITWTNQDVTRHNAYSNKAGGPKGPLLNKGQSFSWTPKKAGTYKYYCTPHQSMASMQATVVVKK